jgi:YD repeat-containing protein
MAGMKCTLVRSLIFMKSDELSTIIKATLTFVLTLVVFAPSLSQEIAKADIQKFRIKSIATIENNGDVKSIEYFNEAGDKVKVYDIARRDTILQRVFTYTNGLLTEELVYTTEGKVHQTNKYTYNTANQLIKKEYFSQPKNEVSASEEFFYDNSGRLKKEIYKSHNIIDHECIFEYEEGRLSAEEIAHKTIGRQERTTYKYDETGKLIRKTQNHFYFDTVITTKYTYDDFGRLAMEREKSSARPSSTILYQYNEEGLLQSYTWKSSFGKESYKTTYLPTFY